MWAVMMLLALVTCLGIGPAWSGQAGPSGAKALFYTGHGTSHMTSEGAPAVAAPLPQAPPPVQAASAPQAAPQVSDIMGVQYWIEVTGRDGSKQRVTPDRVFRSGERIKLFLTTNRPGYLYLLNIGSSGRSRPLYPYPGMRPNENFVQANTPYEVPKGGAIRFDDNPGEELVLLMLSPQPMNDVLPGGGQAAPPPMPSVPAYPTSPAAPAYPPPQVTTGFPPPSPAPQFPPVADPQANPGYQAGAMQGSAYLPPLPSAGYTPEETNRFLSVASAKGSKDLVVETDNTGPQPASYAVAPADSGMVTVQIRLRHQ